VLETLKFWLDKRLTKIFYSLMVGDKYETVLILGKPGTGKSTYAYYALKAALVYKLYKKLGEEVLKGAYCWGAKCEERDYFDEILARYSFVGVEDVERLIRYLVGIADGKNKPHDFVFLDDLIYKYWHGAPASLKKLHTLYRDFLIFRRTFANKFVVGTAVYTKWVVDGFVQTSYVIEGKYYGKYRIFVRKKCEIKEGKYVCEKTWADAIPVDEKYAMPKWLEEEIDKRKRKAMKHVLKKLGYVKDR